METGKLDEKFDSESCTYLPSSTNQFIVSDLLMRKYGQLIHCLPGSSYLEVYECNTKSIEYQLEVLRGRL